MLPSSSSTTWNSPIKDNLSAATTSEPIHGLVILFYSREFGNFENDSRELQLYLKSSNNTTKINAKMCSQKCVIVCLVHKFVDDTTLSELLVSGDHTSNMTQYVESLRTWAQTNKMIINPSKSKEMILGSLAKQPVPCLSVQSDVIERVTEAHVNTICAKVAPVLPHERSDTSHQCALFCHVGHDSEP